MSVEFMHANIGEDAWVYTCPAAWEYGWVTDTEYFEDCDEPITTRRQRWQLVEEQTVVFHPAHELCPNCGGDGTLPDYRCRTDLLCSPCDGSGAHPLAGTMEIVTS